MEPCSHRAIWTRILQAQEVYLEYYAERSELPGVALFTCPRPDAPEFDLAQLYHVATDEAEATLRAIVRHFRDLGRAPRVRLTPVSMPEDWPARLALAGFVETDERRIFVMIPETARLDANPSVVITRAVTPEDADCYSAVQMAGFGVPVQFHEWDRALARRHLTTAGRAFYLASLDGETVGAAGCAHVPGGLTVLYGLATLPTARQRGVATSLIRRRVEDARAAGSTLIFCTAVPGGYAAGFYDRLGFVPLFEVQTFEQR